ncbi:MAG: prolyl oligopeptidase family serine peptidase [Rhodoferax sp.]|nr:prolyl oligopeptidase family serine peptidase [Rhodoferax sp.]MCF8209014.1 prolyl oligopeptidase family serine peptidase [Rhodoferax sp.]
MLRVFLLSLLAMCTGLVSAQDSVAPNPNLRTDGMPAISQAIADKVGLYTDFRGFGFVQWHPVTRTMLVRHREAGANLAQLYTLREPGGALEKVSDFSEPVSAAAFEPVHGRYLLISRDTGGNEATQVYRLDLDSRQTTLLSAPDQRSGFTWTRRGDRALIRSIPLDKTAQGGKRDSIALTLNLVDPMQPARQTRLTELPGGGWGAFRFSPDDTQLAAVQYRTPNDSDVYLIDAKTGQRSKILPKEGASAAGYSGVEWSRDQQRLFLTTNQGGEFSELAVYGLQSKELKVLSRHIPWDIDSFSLSEDGKRLLAVVNANGQDQLHLFDATTGAELPRPTLSAGSISHMDWHTKSQAEFAYALNSPQSPGDVYSLDVASGKSERWTQARFPAGVDPERFVSPELVSIKSFDGLPVSGWLYLPDAKKFAGKRPVKVDFHGGPEGQSTVHFMGRWNYFLNEMGIAILRPNVRGSSGFGKSFMELDNGFKRKDSVKDGGAFLQWVASHPRLDATRIVVAGGSYGGYMSLATAVDYGDLIRGAIDVVGISNFVSFLNNTESYRRDLRRVEYGDERDPAMRAFQEKIAPLNNASAIKKPLFVVQGKNDPRVPYTEAEQMVAAVRKNGAPVWYLLADNEGHGFRRKVNADYEFYATVKFLESTLLDKP